MIMITIKLVFKELIKLALVIDYCFELIYFQLKQKCNFIKCLECSLHYRVN